MSAVTKEKWGNTESGESIELYTLRTANGIEARITNFGGRLVSLKTPDRHGQLGDIVLGFDALESYLAKNPYFGALVGRFANRIANGEFKLNGHTYTLARNNGENALHGGLKGFDKVRWEAHEFGSEDEPALELTYLSRNGEEGYPGNLDVHVRYTLTADGRLRIDYEAKTDDDTVLNLTNHSYFDLSGAGTGHILDFVVQIEADSFTPVNEHLIPTGELRKVDGTPFDFRTPQPIGRRIDADEEQIKLGIGYDHNFVLRERRAEPTLAATASDPASGRKLEVFTTQPGLQFYTGNHLDGSVRGKRGQVYEFRTGFCFETQHFPDSPNQPNFPSCELKAGESWRSTTIFGFSVD